MTDYTARAIRRDMRRNRITIRDLAVRMDVTQVRVREVRKAGVSGGARCRDWFEAIRRQGRNFAEAS